MVSRFPDCPPRSGVVFPGAGDLGLPQRRLCVLALSLETPGHLQTGSGSVGVRAAPEPLHHGHAAVGVIPETPAGHIHRLLPVGQTESDVHSHVLLAAVHTGAQGKRERPRKAGLLQTHQLLLTKTFEYPKGRTNEMNACPSSENVCKVA